MEDLLRPVIEGLGYELVDVQLQTDRGRRICRVLADRPGGINLDECVGLTREVGPHLEVADLIPGSYVLEVSSPGIQRPLKRAEEFDRFCGERVVIRTTVSIEDRKTFRGVNRGIDENGDLIVEDVETRQSHKIPLAQVRKAHLDPELPFPGRAKK